jgi:hypothetical protein
LIKISQITKNKKGAIKKTVILLHVYNCVNVYSVGQPNSNFSTPYNTISRPAYSQGYDDTTLASRRGNGYTGNQAVMGSNPRLVQGHSNPALDQHGNFLI